MEFVSISIPFIKYMGKVHFSKKLKKQKNGLYPVEKN
jgi:hypothetical protein